MKLFLFLPLFLLCPLFGEAFASEKPRMCYFQLTGATQSSGDEGEALKEKLRLGDDDVLISYFGADKGEARSADVFQDMVDKGTQCSALVISGYHTGSFYPKNPDRGGLDLTFLEKLACNPEHEDWFSNVKALYLHGSRTVNDKYLKDVRENPQNASIDRAKGKGDTETEQDKFIEDGAKRNSQTARTISDVNLSYAHTMDEHNPLSSRYLRAFPEAHIFGFSKGGDKGAGLGKGDEDIGKHIGQILKGLKADDASVSSLSAADKFKRALEKITADECDGGKWTEGDDKKAFRSKKDAVQYKTTARKLGCNLINAKQRLQDAMNALEINPADTTAQNNVTEAKKKIIEALNAINEAVKTEDSINEETKEKLSHLLMNNITETYLLSKKTKDTDFEQEVKDALSAPAFTETLKKKIDSPILPSLKKIDYIKFFSELQGTQQDMGSKIEEIVVHAEELGKTSQSVSNQTLSLLIADKLSQYKLISSAQIDRLKQNLPNDGTYWESDMKIKLSYRSFAAKADGGQVYDFVEETEIIKIVGAVTPEALENNDLDTVFQLSEKIATENRDYSHFSPKNMQANGICITDQCTKNNLFTARLQQHITDAPSKEAQAALLADYLIKSKTADSDSADQKKGKENFQANLLYALGRMDTAAFLQGNKQAFFQGLTSNENLNQSSKEVLRAIMAKHGFPMSEAGASLPESGTTATAGTARPAAGAGETQTFGAGEAPEVQEVRLLPDASKARPASHCRGGATRCGGGRLLIVRRLFAAGSPPKENLQLLFGKAGDSADKG